MSSAFHASGSLGFEEIQYGAHGDRLRFCVFLGAFGSRAVVHAVQVSTATIPNVDRSIGNVWNRVPWSLSRNGAIETT